MNILAIGVHPDDIEFLCVGTLALYAAQGHRVFMAVATNGNIGSPTLSHEEIAAVRRREQEAACAIVGAKLIWMDFDDECCSTIARPAPCSWTRCARRSRM